MSKLTVLSLLLYLALCGCSGDESSPVTPDTTPPEIVSTYPADGATNVSIKTAISATFSEEMDQFSFSKTRFVVSAVNDPTIQYSDKTATLIPKADLAYEQNYTAVIIDSVADLAGNRIDSNYTWSFTTQPTPIMPLYIGNRWEFLLQVIDTLSGQIDSSIEVLEIVRDTIIQSEQWFIDSDGRIFQDKGSLWRRSAAGQAYLHFKYPAIAGESYSGDPDVGEIIDVINTGIQIGVPHGNHICYYYTGQVPTDPFKHRYYYKPEVGPIMIDKISVSGSKLLERRSLIRLDLK